MSQDEDFFIVNNEVPFQNIKTIHIEQLTLDEHHFVVRASMALERGEHPQCRDLIRKDKDLAWLLENIANSGQCALLPKTDIEGLFSNVLGLIAGNQPVRLKKVRLLKERVLTRCLKLIAELVLEQLRSAGEQYLVPIFVFFHENFSLYHNPIYFKEESRSLKEKVGHYFWEKYALFTGKGTVWEQLEHHKQHLQHQRQQLQEVTSTLQDYLGHLCRLQQQFISEREIIKKRTGIAEELLLSFEMQLKYLDLVISQAKQTGARAEQQRPQNQKLIEGYCRFLEQEDEEAKRTHQKLLSEYVRVICENEAPMRIAPY